MEGLKAAVKAQSKEYDACHAYIIAGNTHGFNDALDSQFETKLE